MSYMNFKAVKMTFDSYLAELKDLTELCPNLESVGSGYSHFKGTNYQPAWGNNALLLPHATHISVLHESLFDSGRPKIVEPGWWLWDSLFFKVTFCIERIFHDYHMEEGTIGRKEYTEDGVVQPAMPNKSPRMKATNTSLVLRCKLFAVGLNSWLRKAGEIKSLCDTAPDAIRVKYLKAYEEADDEVKRWERAIKVLGGFSIPREFGK